MNERRDALMAEMNEKIKQRDALLVKLQRSLAIQDLWPACFKLGVVSSYWHGNIYKGLTFTIKVTTPEGEIKEAQFAAKDVPEVLRATMPAEARYLDAQRRR